MRRLVAATVTVTALITAPAVRAAPVDDFLNQMVADEISSSQSPEDLVVAARGVCEMLETENGEQVLHFVYRQTGLDMGQSEVFVADSMHYFCPWQDGSGGQIWQATHPGGQALA